MLAVFSVAATEQGLSQIVIATIKVNWATTLDCVMQSILRRTSLLSSASTLWYGRISFWLEPSKRKFKLFTHMKPQMKVIGLEGCSYKHTPSVQRAANHILCILLRVLSQFRYWVCACLGESGWLVVQKKMA